MSGTLAQLQVLAAWFSPGYPVGAYSYSHGLEWAVEVGDVRDPAGLAAWVGDVIEYGAGRSDAILLAQAMAAEEPGAVAELAEALAPSAERHLETMAQGAAFARTTAAAYGIAVPAVAYPVAVGCAARRLGLPAGATVTLFVQGFAANLVSAGVRLVPVGQTDGQRILAGLLPLAERVAEAALTAPLAAVGGIVQRGDLAAMRHETQYSRLYRS